VFGVTSFALRAISSSVCVLGVVQRPCGGAARVRVTGCGSRGGLAVRARARRAPGGPSPRADRTAPLRPPGAAHRRRALAGAAWSARHDRYLRRAGGDAGHLAAASGVGIAIELERVPCWAGVTPRAAAASGEEYELLVALPRSFGTAGARAFRRATGLP